MFRDIQEVKDLPRQLVRQLQDFFINYNKEEEKVFKVIDILDSKKAYKLIKSPVQKRKK